MPYSREGYRQYSSDERISMVLRSALQDASKVFKKETIDIMFSEKKKDKQGNDLDVICQKWAWKIVGSLKYNKDKQVKLLLVVWLMYNKNKNLDNDTLWHLIWMREGLPLFSERIESFPATGRVAPMDKLDKDDKNKNKSFDDRQW
jgi:hypothetical protein